MAKQNKAGKQKKGATSALAIASKRTGKLSPNQAAFNNLTARIEKLRKDIQRKEAQLETALRLYGAEVPPLEQAQALQSREMLSLLMPIYRKGKLAKTLQSSFKGLLRDLLSTVLQQHPEAPDKELKEFFRELEGEAYEAVAQREAKEIEAEMRRHFKKAGIDIDWDADTPLTEEMWAAKIKEAQEQMAQKEPETRQQRQNEYKTRPQTAKAQEKEKRAQEAEAYRQKNISTIYRQLVKLLHPDLERDEERRLEKETLMKQVTEAYETKNLHALLMLELKWVHNENNHLESLPEEKLTVYLDFLRRQALELENQKWQILNQPRYYALVERYGHRPLTYPEKTVKEEIAFLQKAISQGAQNLQALAAPKPLPYLKEMIRGWQQAQQHDDLDFLVEMLFARGKA